MIYQKYFIPTLLMPLLSRAECFERKEIFWIRWNWEFALWETNHIELALDSLYKNGEKFLFFLCNFLLFKEFLFSSTSISFDNDQNYRAEDIIFLFYIYGSPFSRITMPLHHIDGFFMYSIFHFPTFPSFLFILLFFRWKLKIFKKLKIFNIFIS